MERKVNQKHCVYPLKISVNNFEFVQVGHTGCDFRELALLVNWGRIAGNSRHSH